LRQWHAAAAICGGVTCSFQPSAPLGEGAHVFWVQAKNALGVGPWSAAMRFTVTSFAGPPPSASLVSPAGAGTLTQPTYVWNAVSTSTDYYLWVDGPSGNVLKQWYPSSALCNLTTCSVTPAQTLAAGAHTWWIQTKNTVGVGPWSAAKTFTVVTGGAASPPPAPALQSPSGIITATRPSYNWTAATTATDYYLWVNGPLGPILQQWYFASAVCSGSTCAVAPATTLASGAHTWWVQAKNGAGTGPWSASRSFTVQPQAATDSYFPSGAVWYQDVSSAALDPQSSQVIAWLQSAGGWGLGRMQIDFSIEVVAASAGTPLRAFIPTQDHFSPDCDVAPVPLPPGGALEGESGYECTSDGDCHLIVVQRSTNRLYEMWRANVIGDAFFGGCLAVWDMSRVYGPAGRGENCTSADAAGYPIAPLLFSADEVARGEIPHAIRFILPNSRMRNGVYVHPATHSTGATSGPSSAPPYGARFRLRPDFPLNTLPNEAARVVARALQRYGMFLADGGNVALTAQSDRFTPAKWSGLLGSRDLSAIQVSDFQMVDGGERLPYTGDCVRVQD
jgi:serine/threonine-protein kinase